ncbi:MAG: hypothetical protein ACLQPH_01315 [Acidimicrobiales bacterium]
MTATVAALCTSAALLCSCGGGANTRSGTAATSTTATSSIPPATTPSVLTPGTPGPSVLPGPYWLVEDFTLALLEKNGLPASTITKIFNSPRTLLIVRPRGSVPDSLVPLATKVQSFASFATMQAAIQGSTIEPGVKYVLYDNEAWSFTPGNEQAAPFTYAAQALALAHTHGLRSIFTPAANLSPVLSPGYSTSNQLGSGNGKFSGYLNLNMAGQGAAVSDIVEIQGQQAEDEPGFTSFVRQAVFQAKAAAPAHPVLLGITTAIPGSGPVSSATLTSVVAATKSLVDGYWLNVPGASPQCPNCGQVDAGPAVSFLKSYAGGSGG